MDDDFFSTIDEYRETKPSHILIIKAFKEIKPSPQNWCSYVIFFLLSAYTAASISFAKETVELVSVIAHHLIEIQLAIFGCIFAVYSILLAFLSDGYMKRLARIKEKDKTSMLKNSITYYESVLFLYFISIISSGALIVLTDFLPFDASLTSNLMLDNVLSAIGLLVYLLYCFRVIYEVKSTIYNTIVLFRASIAYRFIDFLEEESNSESKL